VFHHPAWLALLERRYRYSFTAPCVADDTGALVAGLPVARVESRITGRRLVALPFSDLCPPLLAQPGDRSEAALTVALSRLRSHSGLDLEIRAPLSGIPGAHVISRFVHHVLGLEGGAEHIERRVVRSQIRRGIAKARREGVSIELSTAPAALDAFYRLHLRTRRRQGIPTQPKRFVDGFAELFARDLGFTLVACHRGQPIAAAVFLYLHGTLTYKYGASDERHLALRPNNLLFAESIRWASEKGLTRLDLGRTELDNEGLRSFKGAWGAQERPLAYTYLAESPPREGPGQARRALTVLIRRSPPVASRVVGAMLYRHAG
jgi:CelD/BcsL family acetyltransferase involved in cellulose biosynthesis